MLGLESSLLSGSELFGNDEVGELVEGLANVLEAFFELGGLLGGGGPGCRLGPEQPERCSEELALVRFVG